MLGRAASYAVAGNRHASAAEYAVAHVVEMALVAAVVPVVPVVPVVVVHIRRIHRPQAFEDGL